MIHIKGNQFSINKKEEIFTSNKIYLTLLTLRYQTYEGFPQWRQFFRNNF